MNTDAALIEEPELLSEVPDILKRLARTIAYAFYDAELVVTVCLLTKHACIDEDTMLDRLQFDKRQMRQVLARLKTDRLIKQRTIKEKQPDTGNFNIYNFYFINYKVFVNVVKYKLDHIRKKLESEEQQARNRPSFQCASCETNYSDLEVDRLIDFKTGLFTCTHCGGPVEEDASHIVTYTGGSSLAKFNEQMEPIFTLLKACENINLAPDVLEPTPSTTALKAAQSKSNPSSKHGWTTDKKPLDLYDQSIQINVGDEAIQKETKQAKELPVWLSKSTVIHNEDSTDSSVASLDRAFSTTGADTVANDQNKHEEDLAIMNDLLAHENTTKKARLDPASSLQPQHDESSMDSQPDSGDEDRQLSAIASGVTEVATMDSDDDDDDDEEVKVKVGESHYSLSDVTEEIQDKMTDEERDAYLKAYNEVYGAFY